RSYTLKFTSGEKQNKRRTNFRRFLVIFWAMATSHQNEEKEEHLFLAGIIKSTHAKLRGQLKQNTENYSKIWSDHCNDKNTLKKYAEAMHLLATKHWTKSPQTRIDWCRDICKNYFFGEGLQSARDKDARRKQFRINEGCTKDYECMNSNPVLSIKLPFEGKIQLFDVGSCYNPFLTFPEFSSLAVDISPATETVLSCDFLNLQLTEWTYECNPADGLSMTSFKSPLTEVPRGAFHVVVFSLLLEYLPSTVQRWHCCQKACDLLVDDSLLLIITPDSSHQNKRQNMMKSWRVAIESLGFTRYCYEKQEHLHCIAFRKTKNLDPMCLEKCHQSEGVSHRMMYIPQDSASKDSKLDNSDTKV
ncbi:unnamed protein product, partial [Owenia fusiformis]